MRYFNRQSVLELLIRGGALFLGGVFLLSWLFALSDGYDATIWWVDLRFLPGWLAAPLSLAFGVVLMHRAVWPHASGRVLRCRRVFLVGLLVVLVLNTLETLRVSGVGVALGMPIPLTAVLAAGLVWMLRRPVEVASASLAARARRSLGIVLVAGCFSLLAAVSQMVTFGESDYRRQADAIVVYGCEAYRDGTPSQALADRVHTAVELYHEGLAPLIVMSGGPVRGSELYEAEVMADYAVSLGVPREAVLLDKHGLDTQSTAINMYGILSGHAGIGSPRLLAVSHDYHLPRVKLSLEREGLTAYTVPCEIRRGLPSKPYLMAREIAAWWYYFFRPMLSG